jgi:hypothetical protein
MKYERLDWFSAKWQKIKNQRYFFQNIFKKSSEMA